jgi:hypothetical protein
MSLTSRTYSQAIDEPVVQWTFVDPLQELPSAVLPSWDGPNLGVKPLPRPAYIMADAQIRGPICDAADCKSLDIFAKFPTPKKMKNLPISLLVSILNETNKHSKYLSFHKNKA